jgi:alkane 1-monooxygenase
MKVFTLERAGAAPISYVDSKRWLWLASLGMPALPLGAIAAAVATGSEWFLLAPLIFFYGIVPVLDAIVGEDQSNPPEELVPQLSADRYYRYLTWATLPLYFFTLGVAAWFVGKEAQSAWAILAVALSVGFYSGTAITVGHELGHKKEKLERWLAKIVLAVPAYGHFWVEHNRGHHRDVATPEDPASSRFGETIYRFAVREMPGALRRAWSLEKGRLERMGKSAWSLENEILHSWAIAAVLRVGVLAAFGPVMLPFLLIHDFLSWWGLTSANYIEHYGLLRQKGADGKYEKPQPHHSWNSNHVISNLLTFHLERHSDHHAHPTRRYQALRHFEGLPTLPGGYSSMFLLAYVPPLWFKVMNPRVLRAVGGDLARVNTDPRLGAEALAKAAGAAQIAVAA